MFKLGLIFRKILFKATFTSCAVTTMTNVMGLRHHTTQHSGEEPSREDVIWFSSLFTNIIIPTELKCKCIYLSNSENFKLFFVCSCQEAASLSHFFYWLFKSQGFSLVRCIKRKKTIVSNCVESCVFRENVTTASVPHPPLLQITTGTHQIARTYKRTLTLVSVNC